MTPHLMSTIHDSQGALVTDVHAQGGVARWRPLRRRSRSPPSCRAWSATGTASGVGFPAYLCAAVKTGTAQTEPDPPG